MKIWLYFFSTFLRTVLYILLLIITVYFIITHIENSLHYFINYPNLSKHVMGLYYFWQLPDIILQFLPFAVLIAGVIVHWTLSRSGEVAALRGSGLSLWKVSFPLVCGALFYVCIHICIAELIRPHALREYYKVKLYQIEHQNLQDPFVANHWVKSQNGALYFDEYDNQTKSLKKPQYFEFNSTNSDSDLPTVKLVAKSESAFFDDHAKRWVLDNPSLTLYTTPQKYNNLKVEKFTTDVAFEPPKILKPDVNSDELSYFQLSKLIVAAQEANVKITDRLVDLYFKISAPFASLLFLLFTVPFATQQERREASYLSILLCILLTAAYWFGNVALKSLAIRGFLHPFIAAWALNIIFCVIAAFVIVKLDKPS